MLRPLLLVLVVTIVACTTSVPPGYCPPATTQAGQAYQKIAQQVLGICYQEPLPPPQQQARVGDGGACTGGFGDPCSTCILTCIPGGDVCADAALDAATIACVRANCTEACTSDP
jgi:hypothetical protein